jgi:hypothetical protein
MMYQVLEIISLLGSFKSASFKVLSKGEHLVKRFQFVFLMVAVTLILESIVLVVVHHVSPLPKYVSQTGLIFALIAEISALLFIFSEVYLFVATLVMLKKRTHVMFLQEVDHDEKHAMKLVGYSERELQYAQDWIETKISRNESRLKLFFGNKTTILALLGLGWPVVKEMGGLKELPSIFNNFLSTGYFLESILWIFLAIIVGLSLGGIFIKNINERYSYHVSLIKLTIKLKMMMESK